MFYIVELERDVDLEPRMFGSSILDKLRDKVVAEAEGKVDPNMGYIVCVSDVVPQGKGLIRNDGSGYATFKVKYSCIAMRLWKDEVVDAVVTDVHKLGFQCEAGPHVIFVSEHHIPEEFTFRSSGGMPLWVSMDNPEESLEIREGSEVRVRVLGVQMDPSLVRVVATMQGDYLGVINM